METLKGLVREMVEDLGMVNVNLLSRRSLKKVKTIAGQLWKKSSQLNSISNGYLYKPGLGLGRLLAEQWIWMSVRDMWMDGDDGG